MTTQILPIAQAAHEHCLSLRQSLWWGLIDPRRPLLAGEVAKLAVKYGAMRFACLEARLNPYQHSKG